MAQELFTLPALPYGYEALEPHVDAMTMTIHHTKHHQAYITNLNTFLDKHDDLKKLDVVQICQTLATDKVPKDASFAPLRNNAGGHYNHSFFWKVMTNPSNTNGALGDVKQAIEASFGSVDEMQKKFNAAAAARFGSGWAWLGVKSDGTLAITSTPNQDNPLMEPAGAEGSMIPILGLDVWEHAYYLKYQNRRPEYIAAWWNVVNWEQVQANYASAKAGAVPV